MSGTSYCTVCDTVGAFGTEHKGCSLRTNIGTMPIEVQGRFVAGIACTEDVQCDISCEANPFLMCTPCYGVWAATRGHEGDECPLMDYAQDYEAGEALFAEFGWASDWDEPFAADDDVLMDDVPFVWLSTQPVRFPTMRVEWGA